jgi:homoserine O-succinyltransferase/O-acetyltransferase
MLLRLDRSGLARCASDGSRANSLDERVPWLDIGLLNNMPDAAIEATENQFASLLEQAAGPLPVRLRFYSLPEIPRAQAVRARMESIYRELPELWSSRLDALIVTGAEPRSSDLRQEAFWSSMVDVIEWSRSSVSSAVWSCLAAHAAVLHLDGVQRRPLPRKCCGVFEHELNRSHALTQGVTERTCAPHSRWNEVARDSLESCGYDILTDSAAAGVNLFAKRSGSLFVFWQGHPEYEQQSLLKEYQRDVGRFLRGERDDYPAMPENYFDADGTSQLLEFKARARSARQIELLGQFPLRTAAFRISNSWRPAAVQHYRQWLQALVAAAPVRRTA